MPETDNAMAGAGAAEILTAIQIPDREKYKLLDTPEIKVLFLKHGQSTACLLTADVCVLNRADAMTIRHAVADAINLPVASVHVYTSHTHAPGGLRCHAIDQLAAAAGTAARQARDNARPAAQVGCLSLNTNRKFNINRRTRTGNLGVWCLMQSDGCRDDGHAVDGTQWVRKKMLDAGADAGDVDLIEGPFLADRPTDDKLDLLLLRGPDGRNIAGLARFAAHAVICSSGYWQPNITRDYPGVLCDKLAAGLGCPVLFAQGPAADQRPRHQEVGPEECTRIGNGLAENLLQNLTAMRFTPFNGLRCTHREVTAALRSEVPATMADAETPWRAIKRQLENAGHHSVLALLERKRLAEHEKFYQKIFQVPGFLDYLTPEERRTKQARLEVSLVQIGAACILQFPGELAASATAGLQPDGGAPLIVTSYTNGTIGYMLPPIDFAEGGYETTSALLTPETALQLRAAGLQLLHSHSDIFAP